MIETSLDMTGSFYDENDRSVPWKATRAISYIIRNDATESDAVVADNISFRNSVSWRVPNITDDERDDDNEDEEEEDCAYRHDHMGRFTKDLDDSDDEDGVEDEDDEGVDHEMNNVDDLEVDDESFYVHDKCNASATQQKLWNFLFRNLDSTVDELYCMCEMESSVYQCEEAVRALDSCKSDFLKLIARIRMQSEAHTNNNSMNNNNPKPLAWEVRTGRNIEKPMAVKTLENIATKTLSVNNLLPSKSMGSQNNNNDDEDVKSRWADVNDENANPIGLSCRKPHNFDECENEMNTEYLYEAGLSDVGNSMTKLSMDNLSIYTNHEEDELSCMHLTSLCSLSPINGNYRRTLHDKLSSPERKRRSPSEMKRRHEKRFFAAEVNRTKIDSARQTRLRMAAERLKDVNERNAQKLAQQEVQIMNKQCKADAIHEAHLRWIVRKAGSENTKVDEVGFIKSMTVEHMKASLQQRLDNSADRREQFLHQIRARAREKAENIRAASERRQLQLETVLAERHAAIQKRHEDVQARRLEIQEEMRRKKMLETQQKESKALERRKLVEKCRRIIYDTLRTERIRSKEGRGGDIGPTQEHKLKPTQEQGMQTHQDGCRVAPLPLNSEDSLPERGVGGGGVGGVGGGKGGGLLLLPCRRRRSRRKEREKTMRQKIKKLRQRLAANSRGYVEPPHLVAFQASEATHRRFTALLALVDVPFDPVSESALSLRETLEHVERALGDLTRFLEVRSASDLHTFRRIGGIRVVRQWASRAVATLKTEVAADALLALSFACVLPENKDYVLATNCLPSMIELFVWSLKTAADKHLIICALDAVTIPLRHRVHQEEYTQITQDLIKYVVNAGAIVCIADRFDQFRQSLHLGTCPSDTIVLLKCIEFLETLTATAGFRSQPVFTMADLHLPIVELFKDTGLMGIVSLLLSLLMESPPQRCSQAPMINQNVLAVSCVALRVLNNVACLDISLTQSILGSLDLQQEFIHMLHHFLSIILQELSQPTIPSPIVEDVFEEILVLIGYYALENPKNQETLRGGSSPNILQKLTNLPFQYFIDPRYKSLIFPTLISVCYGDFRNKSILEIHVNPRMLTVYIESLLRQFSNTRSDHRQQQHKTELVEDEDAMSWTRFASRFPVSLWQSSLEFFQDDSNQTCE